MALGVADRQQEAEQQEQLRKTESKESSWLAGARERLNRIAIDTKERVMAVLEQGKAVVKKTVERLGKEKEATPEEKAAAVDQLFDPKVATVDKIGSVFSGPEGKMRVVGYDPNNNTIIVRRQTRSSETGRLKQLMEGSEEAEALSRSEFNEALQIYTKVNVANVNRGNEVPARAPLSKGEIKQRTAAAKEKFKNRAIENREKANALFDQPIQQVVGTILIDEFKGEGTITGKTIDGKLVVHFAKNSEELSRNQVLRRMGTMLRIKYSPQKPTPTNKPKTSTTPQTAAKKPTEAAYEEVDNRPPLNKAATLRGLFNPSISPQRKIGIEFRRTSSKTLRRVVGVNANTGRLIVRRIGKNDTKLEEWSTNDFQRMSDNMTFYQGKKINFEYNSASESIDTSQLSVGDVISCRTKSGSEYAFRVVEETRLGPKVVMIAGPSNSPLRRTLESGAVISNKILTVQRSIGFESNEGPSNTSALQEIRINRQYADPTPAPQAQATARPVRQAPVQQPVAAKAAPEQNEQAEALKRNWVNFLLNPNIPTSQKIGVEIRNKKSSTIRRVVNMNPFTQKLIIERITKDGQSSTEEWDRQKFDANLKRLSFHQGAPQAAAAEKPLEKQRIRLTPQQVKAAMEQAAPQITSVEMLATIKQRKEEIKTLKASEPDSAGKHFFSQEARYLSALTNIARKFEESLPADEPKRANTLKSINRYLNDYAEGVIVDLKKSIGKIGPERKAFFKNRFASMQNEYFSMLQTFLNNNKLGISQEQVGKGSQTIRLKKAVQEDFEQWKQSQSVQRRVA